MQMFHHIPMHCKVFCNSFLPDQNLSQREAVKLYFYEIINKDGPLLLIQIRCHQEQQSEFLLNLPLFISSSYVTLTECHFFLPSFPRKSTMLILLR